MITGRVKLGFIHLLISLVLLSTSWGGKKAPLPDWDTAEPKPKWTYTPPPLVKGAPFIGIWNVPDACYKTTALGQPLLENRMKYFGFISNYKDNDQEVKLFYKEHFGKFPYFAHHKVDQPKNGGIPYKGNYDAHIKQSMDGYAKMIPTKNKAGLAILDFEQWRPLWIRNWSGKKWYRSETEAYCEKHCCDTEPCEKIKCQDCSVFKHKVKYFEDEAWRYLLGPLEKGRNHSTKKLWGYYLFPDCYNTHYGKNKAGDEKDAAKWKKWNEAPGCPDTEFRRNFALGKLWANSTGLFPSVYLDYVLHDHMSGRRYTRHRIRESIKMSFAPQGHDSENKPEWPKLNHPDDTYTGKWKTGRPTRNLSVPIYVYVRNAFKDEEDKHLSELDLVNTIGESAAQGVGGFIAWGKMRFAMNKVTCTKARDFLDNVMLPYLLNVSTSAKMCSKALCHSRGRCSRVKWNTDNFLHLDPKRFTILKGFNGWMDVKGELSNEDINYFKDKFKCVCYSKPDPKSGLANCSLPTVPPPEVTTIIPLPPVKKPMDHKDPSTPPLRNKLEIGLAAGVGGVAGVLVGGGAVYAIIR